MQHLNSLSKSQQDGVIALINAATQQDGTPPISEHIVLHLRHGGDKSDSHLIIEKENTVIGYAHIDATDLVGRSKCGVSSSSRASQKWLRQ